MMRAMVPDLMGRIVSNKGLVLDKCIYFKLWFLLLRNPWFQQTLHANFQAISISILLLSTSISIISFTTYKYLLDPYKISIALSPTLTTTVDSPR